MHQLRKTLPGVVGTLLISLIGLAGWFISSLPPKFASLEVQGLTAEVSVTFDHHGIPSISAADLDDAAFGLGFVHARDRLWQMESMRRFGAGRLSEILGSRTLQLDRFTRTLGFYKKSEEALGRLEPNVQRHLESYAAGVNAWLSQNRDALPPEFILLGHEPEPWKPADSVVWGKLMALELSGNFRAELLRARLADKNLEGKFDELWPPYPSDAPITVPEPNTAFRELVPVLRQLAEVVPDRSGLPTGASNVWVVDGKRSKTGAPLLANDPHLGFSAPILWYLAEIKTPDLTVRGATAPGVPYVIVGQNDHVAWGFTTTQADLQDVFIEQNTGTDGAAYETASGPRPYENRLEIIRVRDSDDQELTVRSSYHGPIISDLVKTPNTIFGRSAGEFAVSLSATFLQSEDTTPQAIYHLNKAMDRASLLSALSAMTSPMLNVMFADRTGEVGFHATGLLPRRKKGDGFVISPGWTGDYDWDGYIPFDELPSSVNPKSGVLINANNKVGGQEYLHFISHDWATPYRASRIVQSLEPNLPASLKQFSRLQQDHVSQMARDMLPVMVPLVRWSGIAADVKHILENWDGRMGRDDPAPLLFMTWFQQLMTGLFKDELSDDFLAFAKFRPLTVKQALQNGVDWCDDKTTTVIESCQEITTQALQQAVSQIREVTGSEDPENWKWGEFHRASFIHPVLGGVPLLSKFVNLSIPSDGGNFTVNRGTARFRSSGMDFSHIHGSGFRGVYDLKTPADSLFIIATGQSGNFLSKHYRTFLKSWRDGQYVKFGKGESPTGTLVLRPAD